MPKRIQRKRIRGWRMPEGTVYVGRGSKWGNPYRAGDDNLTAVRMFREFLARAPLGPDGESVYDDIQHELAGKDLACWCQLDQPCHADVLLDLANPEKEE